MSIETRHTTLPISTTAISALLVYDTSYKNMYTGTILIYHGLGESKEYHHDLHREEQALLAEAGFLLVNIDVAHHGARKDEVLGQVFTAHPDYSQFASFLRIINDSIQEIPAIVDHIAGWQTGKIGILGHSLGGSIVFGAVAIEPRLQVAVSVMGSPVWQTPATTPEIASLQQYAPVNTPDRFFPCPLLMISAEKDRAVTTCRDFWHTLQPYYQTLPERLAYIEYQECGRILNENAQQDFRERNTLWFKQYLLID